MRAEMKNYLGFWKNWVPKSKLLKNIVEILTDCVTRSREAQLPMVASSLAYTTLLSIVPVLALSFSIFQAFGGMERLYAAVEPMIVGSLAQGAGEETLRTLHNLIGRVHAGAVGAGGLIGLLVTCVTMLSGAEKAIHRVWNEELKRPWFNRMAAYWFFITLGPISLAVVVGLLTSTTKEVSDTLPLIGNLLEFLPHGFSGFCLGSAFFYLIYKYVPSRVVHPKAAIAAALFATVGISIAKLTYAFYNKKVLTYSKLYGSLAAVPIFLVWIYILWWVVLMGAALSAAIQKRRELR